LRKVGTGTQFLGGFNPYTGPTDIDAGALMVGGSISGSTTTVHDGGTIGGSGQLGPLLVESAGSVAAGTGAGTLGTGNVTLMTGSHLLIELGGTGLGQYDQLNVAGTVNLAGEATLSLLGGFIPQAGDTFFVIINNGSDPISGTFSNAAGDTLSLGALEFSVDYAANFEGAGPGNDVSLTLTVPEPGSAALIGGLGLLLLRRRRAYAAAAHEAPPAG
jgi:autotransporter-associated beta strand protein